MEFTNTQTEILRRAQGDLPDSATPFADIAAEVSRDTGESVTEEDVLTLLKTLKDNGAIRRFGATLRHQKAGYGANAMVAWNPPTEDEIHRLGEAMAKHPQISHCYYRKGQEDWPYSLYTMVHAKSRDECVALVADLDKEHGPVDHAILFSIKELKKTSMMYF